MLVRVTPARRPHRTLRRGGLRGRALEHRRPAEATAVLGRVVGEQLPVGFGQRECLIVLLRVERDQAVDAQLEEEGDLQHTGKSHRCTPAARRDLGGAPRTGCNERGVCACV